jgi:uncharacterized membrane protein YagU involved in acid resistance
MASIWKSIAAGAMAGAAAVAAMNAYQAAVNALTKEVYGGQAVNLDDAATLDVAKSIAKAMCGFELSDEQERCAFLTVQYSLGVALGALYGFLAERFPAASIGGGTAFGAAAWLVGDEIAVPLLGFTDTCEYRRFAGHANALAGHVVFGAATDATRKLLLKAI